GQTVARRKTCRRRTTRTCATSRTPRRRATAVTTFRTRTTSTRSTCLHCGLAGRPLHQLRWREGRLRCDRPAWQQRTALVAALLVAPRLHDADKTCRATESRCLRTQSVLRQSERDARIEAP